MARLPDPRPHADPATLAEIQRMALLRSYSDGRAELGSVYIAMFTNPAVARAVGALGERLRFEGTLPDQLREIAILRFAARSGYDYAWAHHVRPATLAGVSKGTIEALAAPVVPPDLDPVGGRRRRSGRPRRRPPGDSRPRAIRTHGGRGIRGRRRTRRAMRALRAHGFHDHRVRHPARARAARSAARPSRNPTLSVTGSQTPWRWRTEGHRRAMEL